MRPRKTISCAITTTNDWIVVASIDLGFDHNAADLWSCSFGVIVRPHRIVRMCCFGLGSKRLDSEAVSTDLTERWPSRRPNRTSPTFAPATV
jgi:hypothetical protein